MMTDQQIKANVFSIMSKTTLSEAKKSVVEANDNFEINNKIFDFMMSYLRENMSEEDFLDFCDAL